MPPGRLDASIVSGETFVIKSRPLVRVIVWPESAAAKLIVSPELAPAMRVRSVPAPLLAVLVTVQVAALQTAGARARASMRARARIRDASNRRGAGGRLMGFLR